MRTSRRRGLLLRNTARARRVRKRTLCSMKTARKAPDHAQEIKLTITAKNNKMKLLILQLETNKETRPRI